MLDPDQQVRLRRLPAIESMLSSPLAEGLTRSYGRPAVTAALRYTVDRLRQEILNGGRPEVSAEAVLESARGRLASQGLRRVVNATGVIIHTNLGRSLLAPAAVDAVVKVASHYSNLEYDLEAGGRGSRYSHSVPLLTELTGAQDALVLNNCAAATLLALTVVAGGGEVIVSRGQLIEIGGGFRIPEVLEMSGARLREVGTTNRTRLSDYERAINEETKAILWVHPSNFSIAGFTESVGVGSLVDLGLPVVADLGSGALLPLSSEPQVQAAVQDGASLVTFSGDKLLGGPQAGIAVGEKKWVEAMRRHPLARALRTDKLCLAALEATLSIYLEGTGRVREEIPTLTMFHTPATELKQRAGHLAREIKQVAPGLSVDVVESIARSGGGTLPVHGLSSFGVRIGARSPAAIAARLREFDPPIVGRISEDKVLLDVMTLLPDDSEHIVKAFGELAHG